MKTAAAASILALFSSALAAPLEARHSDASPFELTVSFSNSPLSGPLQANGGSFWIGKKTASSCPTSVGKACPPGNSTSFASDNTGTLSLNTEVPGGQQVYIAPNGLLSYTPAHSASIPTGSITSGLVVNDSNNLFNKYFTYWLCNTEGYSSEYQVWLEYRNDQGSVVNNGNTGKNTCTRINLLAKDVKKGAAAWQYS